MPNLASLSAWTSVTITLNSVANGSRADGTTDFANGTDLDIWADVSLVLGSLTPGTGGFVELHLRPLLHDATNYADVTPATLAAAAPLSSGASAKYTLWTGLLLPPGTFRFSVVNRAGVAFGGSGNALQARTYATG